MNSDFPKLFNKEVTCVYVCIYIYMYINCTDKLCVYTHTYVRPVAARSKNWVCGRSPGEVVGSNPVGGMNISCECCVVR